MKPMYSCCNRLSHLAKYLTTLFVVLALAGPVSAQYAEQKLTASGGGGGNLIGYYVSISGDRAIVGARSGPGPGPPPGGTARVYERQENGHWEEVARLDFDEPGIAYFGISVSIFGDRALLGLAFGGAIFYERQEDGGWEPVAQLGVPSGAVGFGTSVSLWGDRAVVGAYPSDDSRGRAYVYERQEDGSWVGVAQLITPNAQPFDFFGESVSISDDRIIGGARGNDDLGFASGSAHVFERQEDGSWEEAPAPKLTASDGSSVDQFGRSVSLSGGLAIVGADGEDDNGSNAGAAYVFERQEDGRWEEVTKLTASDGAAFDHFGWSVSLSGDRAIVGAYGTEIGAVYVFERQEDSSWEEVAKITPSDIHNNNTFFGKSVSISGDAVLVGAETDDDNGISSGAAYVYDLSSPALPVTLTPDSDPVVIPADGGSFEYTMAVTNTTSEDLSHDAWISLVSPIGSARTLFGPRTITIPSGATVSRTFVQQVSAGPENTATISGRVGTFDTGVAVGSDAFQVIREGALLNGGRQDLWPLAEADRRGWVVTAAGEAGGVTASAVEMLAAPAEEVPMRLGAGYPNPFNPQTIFSYDVATAGHVSVAVYNAIGQEVARLVDSRLEPGHYQATFDAHKLPSGVYFVRMASGSFAETQRVTLMK